MGTLRLCVLTDETVPAGDEGWDVEGVVDALAVPEGDEGDVEGGGGGGGSDGLGCVTSPIVCVPSAGLMVVKSPLTPPAALKKL